MVSIEKYYAEQTFVIEENTNETVQTVKAVYNHWFNHYSLEPSGWPVTNIQAWSINQTLITRNYRHFGLVEVDDLELKKVREKAVINYLIGKSASGVKSWAKDVLERKNLGLASKEEYLLAKMAVTCLAEKKKETTEL